MFIHIDDGIGISKSKEGAAKEARVVQDDLKRLGLVTSPDKCEWTPTQSIVWCGFVWNTREWTVKIEEKKVLRIKEAAGKIRSNSTATARQVAALAGLIISCTIALGRNARFRTRMMSMWITSLVEEFGWNGFKEVTVEIKDECDFWIRNVEKLNCQEIRKPASLLRIDAYGFSDAGGHQLGGFMVDRQGENISQQYKVMFTEEERFSSSTLRELRGIEEGLRLHGQDIKGRRVRWACDNWAAVKACELGTTKHDAMVVATRIAELVEDLKIEFEVVWRRRNSDEIVICDKISKDFDASEYKIKDDSFKRIEEEFGEFEMDWFASSWSARTKQFASRFKDKGAVVTDAFSGDWSKGWGFFQPPIGLVAAVLDKAREEGARGILVVPDWPGSQVVLTMDLATDVARLRGCRKLEFISAEFVVKKVFHGLPDFKMRLYELGTPAHV